MRILRSFIWIIGWSVMLLSPNELFAQDTAESSMDTTATAREDSVEKDSAWKVVEEEPQFPGGDEEMMRFIQDNVTYPDTARRSGIEEKVYVGFVVEKDGSLTRIRVVNEVHPSLAEEAERVIEKMPRWEPGTQKGQKVRVEVKIPILFKLD